MLSQQTRYTPPEEQYPTPPESNTRFVEHTVGTRHGPLIALSAFSVALAIVSIAMMVGMVDILLTGQVYAELGLTGALIGIGISGFVLICVNAVIDYLIFSHIKR